MKKIINGKTYNTETADWICEYEHGHCTSFNWYDESLYVTKNGAYFIHGEGGANSPYARIVDQNCWGGGDGFRVLTKEEAREYTEKHASYETYVKFFGEPEEA